MNRNLNNSVCHQRWFDSWPEKESTVSAIDSYRTVWLDRGFLTSRPWHRSCATIHYTAATNYGNDSNHESRKFQAMARASARHILVKDEALCESLKQQIQDGSDFAEVAKEHSDCPSGQQGGALGEFSPGQMVPEFDQVVFSAEVNQVHGPVQTQFGYHLIEITDRTD